MTIDLIEVRSRIKGQAVSKITNLTSIESRVILRRDVENNVWRVINNQLCRHVQDSLYDKIYNLNE